MAHGKPRTAWKIRASDNKGGKDKTPAYAKDKNSAFTQPIRKDRPRHPKQS